MTAQAHLPTPMLAAALLLAVGFLAQWLAWRLRLPAILLLLGAGFLLGPVFTVVDVDALLGPTLRPFVSFSVAVILFEGGLTLNFRDLKGSGAIVRNLVTVGALVTWVLAGLAAVHICGLSTPMAVLVGAILVLTGPTVVVPLVRLVRPTGPVGPILQWEGILIDPIGALLALLALEYATHHDFGPVRLLLEVAETVLIGGGLGLLGAFGLLQVLGRYWLPDSLHVPAALATVAVSFAVSDHLQDESGLLAVTVLGIVLANQRRVDLRHVKDFKEELGLVLLTVLFLVLSARLRLDDFTGLGAWPLLFVGVLIVVVRPVAVWLSTIGSRLDWRERLYLGAMAPRGIVAVALCSELVLHLEAAQMPDARTLVAVVFPVIVVTVCVYGLSARPLATALRLAERNPQGLLCIGGDAFARDVAGVLAAHGVTSLLVDTNAANVSAARLAGLRAWHGSALSDRLLTDVGMTGLGSALAMTTSEEVNLLSMRRFARVFGRAAVFQLAPLNGADGRFGLGAHGHGRTLFTGDLDARRLLDLYAKGARVKATRLTGQFNAADFAAHYGERAIPLLLVGGDGKVTVATTDRRLEPRPGQVLVSLVLAPDPGAAPERDAAD